MSLSTLRRLLRSLTAPNALFVTPESLCEGAEIVHRDGNWVQALVDRVSAAIQAKEDSLHEPDDYDSIVQEQLARFDTLCKIGVTNTEELVDTENARRAAVEEQHYLYAKKFRTAISDNLRDHNRVCAVCSFELAKTEQCFPEPEDESDIEDVPEHLREFLPWSALSDKARELLRRDGPKSPKFRAVSKGLMISRSYRR